MNRNLGAIFGAGLVLRFLLLGKRQLTTDELTQVLVVHEPSFRGMMERLRGGMAIPAPLDYLIQKGVVLLLGESTWSLRLHAALLGAASLWFFFRIARLLFGRRIAFYATTLFALYPLHHHHSQEGRPYALLVFLTLASYDLFLHGVCGKRRGWRFWALLCLIQVLLLYASFLGLLVMASQFIGLVGAAMISAHPEGRETPEVVPRPDRSHIYCYALVAVVACVLFVPWVRFGWSKPRYSPPSEVADPKIVLRLVKEIGDNSYPISGLLLIGAGLGIRTLARHGRARTLWFLLSWLLLSLPAVLLLELWSGYYFAIRHILHSTPPLILLAGYGMVWVGERFGAAPARIGSPALGYATVLLIMLAWTAWVHGRAEPSDWRGAAAYLEKAAGKDDAVAIPKVYPLVEYHAPSLASFRSNDREPEADFAAEGGKNRFILCCDKLFPDPCAGFRDKALADPAWKRVQFRGLTLFRRAK